MPPRGRPPGRKNGMSKPQNARKELQEKKAAKKADRMAQKVAKKKTKVTPPETETAVAEPAALQTPDKSEASRQLENDDDANDEVQQNGVPSPAGESPQPPVEGNVSEDESAAATSAPPPAVAARPLNGQTAASGHLVRGGRNSNPRGPHSGYAASSVDLDAINYRQMSEDIDAYRVDLEFCDSQLALRDLTPQETRTLQLRRLDLSHQIRFSQHRKEVLEAQRLLSGGRPLSRPPPGTPRNGAGGALIAPVKRAHKRVLSLSADDRNGAASASQNKRARAASELSVQDTISMHSNASDGGPVGKAEAANGYGSDVEIVDSSHYGNHSMLSSNNDVGDTSVSLQRLGFWKCRLCVSEKYLDAGPERQPNAPSKWPLKDIGKLMSHYFDMHTEHDPDERCAELGAALDNNRGPFEYWLRKSRAQKIPDRSIMDDAIAELQAGRVPKLLRDLCRAAAAFPGA